jgi:hypothetical protein
VLKAPNLLVGSSATYARPAASALKVYRNLRRAVQGLGQNTQPGQELQSAVLAQSESLASMGWQLGRAQLDRTAWKVYCQRHVQLERTATSLGCNESLIALRATAACTVTRQG